jgi:hypothetical protein
MALALALMVHAQCILASLDVFGQKWRSLYVAN